MPVFAVESGSTIDSTVNTPAEVRASDRSDPTGELGHEIVGGRSVAETADADGAERRQPCLEDTVVVEHGRAVEGREVRHRGGRPLDRLPDRRTGEMLAFGDRPQPAGMRL